MSKDQDNLYLEAYSQIIWGQKTNVVLQYLQSRGVGTQASNQMIDECLKAREQIIRSLSIRNILKGGLVFISSHAYANNMTGELKFYFHFLNLVFSEFFRVDI